MVLLRNSVIFLSYFSTAVKNIDACPQLLKAKLSTNSAKVKASKLLSTPSSTVCLKKLYALGKSNACHQYEHSKNNEQVLQW